MAEQFMDRLKRALEPRGYESSARRSVQTAVLYEARRSISDRIPNMRPFQRKMAVLDQAKALVDAMDFLRPHQRDAILWRTGTARECIDTEVAWRRAKAVDKELLKIRDKLKNHQDLMGSGISDPEQLYQDFLQATYEQVSQSEGKVVPNGWEHVHNHNLLTYHMYFSGLDPDPTVPDPIPITDVVVPVVNPSKSAASSGEALKGPGDKGSVSNGFMLRMNGPGGKSSELNVIAARGASSMPRRSIPTNGNSKKDEINPSKVAASAMDNRQSALQEVRMHMDLLKDFEGVISEEEINRRKRQLFLSLPEVPPPILDDNNKRIKGSNIFNPDM